MVRTKADRVPAKAVGSKAPRKISTPSKKSATAGKAKSYSGGNPYHPRETPAWQKPITCFLNESKDHPTDASTSQGVVNDEVSEEADNDAD